ncbi:hypothetical protein [Nisaea sp.]|uniref:hypothetical protein n=1 Tax=Nisaea sp. TaxID=2024842 RepID=UPI003B5271E5
MQTVSVPGTRLALCLLLLRLAVALVLGMWVLNKFLNPGGTSAVLQIYYGLPGIAEALSYLLGALQAIVVLAFLTGFQKRWATALVFLMHLVSSLSPISNYLDPWTPPNLLFFAAWPMLAAIATIYLLRDFDTLLSLQPRRGRHGPTWQEAKS